MLQKRVAIIGIRKLELPHELPNDLSVVHSLPAKMKILSILAKKLSKNSN